jgi:hypothetical protein
VVGVFVDVVEAVAAAAEVVVNAARLVVGAAGLLVAVSVDEPPQPAAVKTTSSAARDNAVATATLDLDIMWLPLVECAKPV